MPVKPMRESPRASPPGSNRIKNTGRTQSAISRKPLADQKSPDDPGVKQHPMIEESLNRYLGRTILLFLSALSLVVLVAAAITAFDTVVRDFPRLWQPTDEYSALQHIIENILLVAITAELA